MEVKKKNLLIIYVIFIVLVGVIFVPYKVTYGPEFETYIDSAKFAPLWLLMDYKSSINGYDPIYELQLGRLLYTIFIVTLIFSVIFLLLSNKKHDK